MHIPIDQLLSLRDGEPLDADALRHVDNCQQCVAQLNRLRHAQQQLQSLPMAEPPPAAWSSIQAHLQPVPMWNGRRFPFAVAAALIAAVAGTLWVQQHQTESLPATASVVKAPQASQPQSVPLDRLLAQSRELDDMLQQLPQRPAVERVAMAATIDSIEQRVQWLDQRLSYASDGALNDEQQYRLWRERVDLMDSLVKVRYVEGGRMVF